MFAGVACIVAFKVFLRSYHSNRIHKKDQVMVNTAHSSMMEAYEHIHTTKKAPLAVYAAYAHYNGVVPTDEEINHNHILDRVSDLLDAEHVSPSQPVTPAVHVFAIPGSVMHDSPKQKEVRLSVTNNIDVTLQLTCQEVPSFACWIHKAQTTVLPKSISSPVTLILQGYRADDSTVKLINQVDVSQVSSVCIDDVNGVITMSVCPS